MSGASIALAALLLIIPGFFTDFLGFLLLIPFTRKILFNIHNNKQMSDVKKIKFCDHIIVNEQNIKILKSNLSRILDKLSFFLIL